MELIICKNYEEVSQKASEILIEQLIRKPNSILGLATGSTPVGLYNKLIEAYKRGQVSFKNVITFNLDEYLELDRRHPESYFSFMHKNLFNHIDINEDNIHLPNNNIKTLEGDIKTYNDLLKLHQVDVQVLGIGSNGHIGFNEPGSPFENETFATKLTEQTRNDNLRFFNHIDEVPRSAVTMGIGTIMRSKKIVLIATGLNKADAIFKMLKGPITTALPASALRNHPNLAVIVDELAAKNL